MGRISGWGLLPCDVSPPWADERLPALPPEKVELGLLKDQADVIH